MNIFLFYNNMKDWMKRKMALLSLALSNVEKNALGQDGKNLDSNVNQERRHTQGTLADSLKQGEITQEVKDLRWRTYKILNAIDNHKAEIVDYAKTIDEKGETVFLPITKVRKIDKKKGLNKIKLDTYDRYVLEMVIDNSEIAIGSNEAMENDSLNMLDNVIVNKDDKGEVISATHAEIKSDEYFATNKAETPIKITRSSVPKFRIERYTKKLNIRSISETEKMLEFYISMYPDEYNRTSRLVISDIKKAIDNPRHATFLEFEKVEFITYKSVGVEDFLLFEYNIKNFDKIVEFNGHYVIKFIAEPVINGENVFDKYKEEELDKKYENKEKKK